MSKVFDHLLPAFRTYALLPDEERIGWIRQARWINYSRTDQILGRLAELLDYPPRERMPCLLLFGATGMGKTHLIENSCAIIVPFRQVHWRHSAAGGLRSNAALA